MASSLGCSFAMAAAAKTLFHQNKVVSLKQYFIQPNHSCLSGCNSCSILMLQLQKYIIGSTAVDNKQERTCISCNFNPNTSQHYSKSIMIIMRACFNFLCLALLVASVSAQMCHYSCKTCADDYYAHCYSCQDAASSMLQLGSDVKASYGLCSAPSYSGANPIGILIILIAVFSGLLLRSQHIFYFMLSLQILGLLSFVQVAYDSPLTLLLNSLQYFMAFSLLQYKAKTSDGVLAARGMYRLDAFVKQVDLKTNIMPLFVCALLAATALALVHACRKILSCRCLSDQTLENVLTGLRTFLLLTMQQGLLDIYLAIRFADLGGTQVGIMAAYCIVLVFLLVDINWNKVPYFRSRKLLNLAVAQRLMLPVLAIIPYQSTYQLIIFLTGFAAVELLFYIKSQAKAKHYVYSAVHLFVCILMAVFIGEDLVVNTPNASRLASLFAVLGLSLFIACFLLEIVLALKAKLGGSNKVQNKEDWLKRDNTNDKIAVLREQDTLAEVIEPSLLMDSQKRNLDTQDKRANNVFEDSRRKERKFKVQRD